MTAINVVRQLDAVHIISDGVFCDTDGFVLNIGPNTWFLPHLSAAIGIHGSPHFMPFLINRLGGECRSFDDIAAKILTIALDVHISFPMTHGTLGWGNINPEFDLFVVGWSEARGQPISYLVARPGRGTGSQVSADWRVVELPDLLIAPPLNERVGRADGWKPPTSAEAFQVEPDGIKLVEAQRFTPTRINSEGGIGFSVGGFVQLTSVSAQRVTSRILLRWPDKVGRKIEPQRHEP